MDGRSPFLVRSEPALHDSDAISSQNARLGASKYAAPRRIRNKVKKLPFLSCKIHDLTVSRKLPEPHHNSLRGSSSGRYLEPIGAIVELNSVMGIVYRLDLPKPPSQNRCQFK